MTDTREPFSVASYNADPTRAVETRDGRKVRVLGSDVILKGGGPVVVVVDGTIYSTTASGRYWRDTCLDEHDLFFAPAPPPEPTHKEKQVTTHSDEFAKKSEALRVRLLGLEPGSVVKVESSFASELLLNSNSAIELRPVLDAALDQRDGIAETSQNRGDALIKWEGLYAEAQKEVLRLRESEQYYKDSADMLKDQLDALREPPPEPTDAEVWGYMQLLAREHCLGMINPWSDSAKSVARAALIRERERERAK